MADRDEKDDDKVKPRRVVAFAFGWWLAAGVTVAVAATGAVYLAQRRGTGAERRGPPVEVPRADTAAERAYGPPEGLTVRRERPPHVDEGRGWQRTDHGWIREEVSRERGVGGPRTLVLRCNASGATEIWADTRGIHYCDPGTGDVWTPVDMSSARYRFGPNVNYEIVADPTNSFFYIKWGMMTEDESSAWRSAWERHVLLDSSGVEQWKFEIRSPPVPDTFIANVLPSPTGYTLAFISEGAEGLIGWCEIWSPNGSLVRRLPDYAKDYSWSPDGQRVVYSYWPPPYLGDLSHVQMAVFSKDGELIEGDAP